MKLVIVAGTRPEFVKLAPVVAELRRRDVPPTIYATGQHTDLLRGTPFEDGMRPDVSLGLPGSNDPFVYASVVEGALRAKWAVNRPELVVVQGDTASAYAGALAASHLEIPVAHVEAGIRSGDFHDPWPEETFRVEIDQLAERMFYATEANRANLEAGVPKHGYHWKNRPRAWVTGNPGIDALYAHTQPLTHPQKVQDRVLITLHRRESFGEPMAAIIRGLYAGARRYPSLEFVWPMHPNPRVIEASHFASDAPPPSNVLVQEPLPTVPFARMLAASRCVITDSGGVQEEAAALGVPCLVAREKTDRPESVELGLARVVGRTPEGILSGLDWALGFQARCTPSTVFGDGHAAPRIVEHLLSR